MTDWRILINFHIKCLVLVESESKASIGYHVLRQKTQYCQAKGVHRSSYRIYSKFIISNRACHWKKFFQLFGDASLLSPRKNCLSVPRPSFMTVLLEDTLAAQLTMCLETGKTMGRLELPSVTAGNRWLVRPQKRGLDSKMEVEVREASAAKDRKIDSNEGKTQTIGWQSLLTFTILSLAWLVGFASRLFAVIRFESIIHEFDPW